MKNETLIKDFSILRENWKNHLIGGNKVELSNSSVLSIVNELSENAKGLWLSMEKSPNRKYLWQQHSGVKIDSLTRLPGKTSDITATFRNINTLAKALLTYGTEFHENKQLEIDIVEALQWMLENSYNNTIAIPQPFTNMYNWWDLEIGCAMPLADTILLMDSSISNIIRHKFLDAINFFNPDPLSGTSHGPVNGAKMTGANLVWKVYSFSVAAIIEGSPEKLLKAKDDLRDMRNNGLDDVFGEVTTGDGFYPDGSFIQHRCHPYIGGYGRSLLLELSNLMFLFSGTPWDFSEEEYKRMYDIILNTFAPFIVKGALMGMVLGRTISRPQETDYHQGAEVISSTLLLSIMIKGEKGRKLASLAKSWIISNTYRDYMSTQKNIKNFLLADTILKDTTILPYEDKPMYKQFSSMDRAVMRRTGFVLGISMSSNRIYKFESCNWENMKGWYTSDGWTCLYNNDLAAFQNFVPTINFYRLPGTTVDTQIREVKCNPCSTEYLGAKNWVGGCSLLGIYGVSGMWLDAEQSTLEGKKSWFMFEEEIVALGAGINSSDNRDIETIIENRRLADTCDNRLLLNGIEKPVPPGWNERNEEVKWAHLEGSVEGADIGYYFPEPVTINSLREIREGCWADINLSAENKPESEKNMLIKENYITMWINHGVNPKESTYAYVLLPNKTSLQTETYSKNPNISILANTSTVQAVKEKNLNIIGANFWNAGSVEGIKAANTCSIMIKDDRKGRVDISVSDPTQTQSEIVLEFEFEVRAVIEKDPEITIVNRAGGTLIRINTVDSLGRSYALKLEKI